MIKHKIFENFLNIEDFNKLIKIDYGAVPDDGIKVFNNSIDSNGNVKNSIIEKSSFTIKQ